MLILYIYIRYLLVQLRAQELRQRSRAVPPEVHQLQEETLGMSKMEGWHPIRPNKQPQLSMVPMECGHVLLNHGFI